MTQIPFGYCRCGCGEKATIALKTDRHNHRVKGQPMQFITGHNRRKSDARWIEEDRGFTTPCWIWQGARSHTGYGSARRKGKGMNAHRAIYQDFHGPLPPRAYLDHLCRERLCVNPAHMEPVSNAENIRRGALVKLSHEKVVEIRSRAEAWDGYQHGFCQAVAADYGVSAHTIYTVVSRRSWS